MTGTIIAAWLDVQTQPLRSLASIIGMVAAVTAVIVVSSASALSSRANEEFVEREYGRVATLQISAPPQSSSIIDDPQSDGGIIQWFNINGIQAVSRDIQVGGAIIVGDSIVPTNAKIVSSTWPDVVLGDFNPETFPTDTANASVPHVVISLELAQELGLDRNSAEGTVLFFIPGSEAGRMDPKTATSYQIVIAAVSTDLGADSETNILIVSDQQLPHFRTGASPRWLVALHPDDVAMGLSLVSSYGLYHGLPASELRAGRTDMVDDVRPLLDQQSIIATAVSLVALAMGGLGVIGIGIAGVRERSKEIGLRRAIGGNHTTVFASMMIQSLIEISISVIIAVPLSVIVVRVFARELVLDSLPLPSSTTAPMSSILVGIVGALIVGVAAATLPAWKAARVSVVKALQG